MADETSMSPDEHHSPRDDGPANYSFAEARRRIDLERGRLAIRRPRLGKPRMRLIPPQGKPWKHALLGALLGGFWSMFAYPFAARRGTDFAIVISAALIAGGALVMGAVAAHRRRCWWLRLAAMNFKVCPDCCYNLRSRPDDGVCPDCGSGYTIEDLEREWARRR